MRFGPSIVIIPAITSLFFSAETCGTNRARHITRWGVEPSKKTRRAPMPSSIAKEKQLAVQPKAFFTATALHLIRSEHLQQYTEWRSKTAGPAIIGMELGLIRRLMKRARLWHNLVDDVVIPRPPETLGRALTPDQKQALLETAACKPQWQTAYYAAVLALNTTMRGCEIKGLQWQDIDFINSTLNIRKSKTAAGQRVIPLNDGAFETLVALRQLAETFGTVEDSHYCFASFKPVGAFDGNQVVRMPHAQLQPATGYRIVEKGMASAHHEGRLEGFTLSRYATHRAD